MDTSDIPLEPKSSLDSGHDDGAPSVGQAGASLSFCLVDCLPGSVLGRQFDQIAQGEQPVSQRRFGFSTRYQPIRTGSNLGDGASEGWRTVQGLSDSPKAGLARQVDLELNELLGRAPQRFERPRRVVVG
jgi:hypothetical protein